MIKIYGTKNSSAFRCLWLLEELGVEYENAPLDIKNGENKSEWYLKLNPNGKIPTLVDGEFALWESLAINYYLVEKFQAFDYVGATLEEHAQVNQWNFWCTHHLYPAFYPLVMQKFRGTPDNEATKNAVEVELPRFLPVLNDHLADKEYMVLGKFTLADITAMSVMRSAERTGYDISQYTNIVRWMNKIAERPAYQKVTAS